MGSIAMDGKGNIALGYSIVDAANNVFPSIGYTGRLAGAPLGSMPEPEQIMFSGTTSQTNADRWGDYSSMNVDPVDDCTFWYTQQHGGGRQTRIGAFKFTSCVRTISINNVSHNEGNAGTTAFTFTVSLSAPTGVVTTVNWATADGSATTADGDYNAAERHRHVPVRRHERDRHGSRQRRQQVRAERELLRQPLERDGGRHRRRSGRGDDRQRRPAALDLDRRRLGLRGPLRPDARSRSPCRLSNPSYQTIMVDYDTADGTATVADNDYQPTSGTAVFLTGDTSENVTVQVNGDVTIEPDENVLRRPLEPGQRDDRRSPGRGDDPERRPVRGRRLHDHRDEPRRRSRRDSRE